MASKTEKEIALQRNADIIALRIDFYRPDLELADAETYLAQADYNLDQARLAVANDRWHQLDKSLWKDYMLATEENPVAAYKLYQDDEAFYEKLCGVTNLDIPTARWFQGQVVKKFGEDFRYDLNQCVDWHCAWDDGQPIFEDADVDLGYANRDTKRFIEGFRSVTGATTVVAVQYGKRFEYKRLNDAAEAYWNGQAGVGKGKHHDKKGEAKSDSDDVGRGEGQDEQVDDATAQAQTSLAADHPTSSTSFQAFEREIEADHRRISLLRSRTDRKKAHDPGEDEYVVLDEEQ
jgi:hypothetical protein